MSNFTSVLNNYINNGYLSRQDKLIGYLFPEMPYRLNAGKLISSFQTSPNSTGSITLDQQVHFYNGENRWVLKMIEYLNAHLSNDLHSAYIHGSLATNEEINYSDFDGLVIIKNEVFDNPERLSKVAITLNQATSFMISHDPLQHHGWFVLTEKDFINWPSSYFPPVLFEYSKSIFNSTVNLKLNYANNHLQFKSSLNRIIKSIISKLENDSFPENNYQLKSLLSEFMLLPALFIQAKTGEGIFKKQSFIEAKKYFSESEWIIMEEVSSIREQWDLTKDFTINSPTMVTSKLKKLQIKSSKLISANHTNFLNLENRKKMMQLATLCGDKIK